jgi:hypothetical protein
MSIVSSREPLLTKAMILRNRIVKPSSLIVVGMILLALAQISLRFLRPSTGLPEGPADGITGLLYGIAFGVIFLALVRLRRLRRS